MKGFVVRSCLTFDLLLALCTFLALIWVDPDRYAETLAASGASIRQRIARYRAG